MKDKKYIIFLVAVIALYVVFEMRQPKSLDWTTTYHHQHKIPFGTFATHQLWPDLFDGQSAAHAFKTVYELADNDISSNLLLLGDEVNVDRNDLNALLDHVNKGNTVLVSALKMNGLADSLGFTMVNRDPALTLNFEAIQASLTGTLNERIMLNLSNGEQRAFEFSVVATTAYFDRIEDGFEVLAVNQENRPVLMKYTGLEGNLYLSSMPLSFTNYFVLNRQTSDFASAVLSLFPESQTVLHNEYYQLGRLESQSPLRVLLRNPSLRWAIFILLVTLLVFLVFDSRRKQRAIPLVRPLSNLSIEFAKTLGRLYYRQKDHLKLAQKRVSYWKDYVRRHYHLKTDLLSPGFVKELANKSGQEEKSINTLLKSLERVEAGEQISESELMEIEKRLNQFYGIS